MAVFHSRTHSHRVIGGVLRPSHMQDEHRDGDRDDGAGNDQDEAVKVRLTHAMVEAVAGQAIARLSPFHGLP